MREDYVLWKLFLWETVEGFSKLVFKMRMKFEQIELLLALIMTNYGNGCISETFERFIEAMVCNERYCVITFCV